MQAIIFCGIQGSGKSTYYKEHFFNTHVRISMDLLRTRHREMLFLKSCLKTQQRFVVDNTNPTVAERQLYVAMAKEARFEVVCYFFEAAVGEALQRNSLRSGRFRVPDKGVFATQKKLQPPSLQEGFDLLYRVRLLQDGTYTVVLEAADAASE